MFPQVGKGCTGKSSVVRALAELSGHKLLELPMSSITDTTDLLGGYEQVHYIYRTLRCWNFLKSDSLGYLYMQVNLRRHCVNLATFVHDSVISLLSAAKKVSNAFQGNSVDHLKSLARELCEEYSPAGNCL